jgi:hypothetical protein
MVKNFHMDCKNFDMGVASTGHMFKENILMHGGRWYRPHDLQKFGMGVARTGHMFNKITYAWGSLVPAT